MARVVARNLRSLAFWRKVKGRFVPPVDTQGLPAALLERFTDSDNAARLVALLWFLSPITTGSAPQSSLFTRGA